MSEIKEANVALLVDADNVSDRYAEDIVKIAAESGNVIVRRGYGVMNPFNWKEDIMLRYAILPVTRFVRAPKKNVTDIALIIDALDIVYRQIVDVVCIASNDSDFSLLAIKLREYGVEVHGIGTHQAQILFVSSCDKFHYLDKIIQGEQQEMLAGDKSAPANHADLQKVLPASRKLNSSAPVSNADLKKVKKVLLDAYNQCDDDDGWVLVQAVAGYIQRMDPEFSPKAYGYGKFSMLVKKAGLFDYNGSEKTNHKIKIQKQPSQKKPGQKKPGQKKPGQKKPGQKKPSQKQPGQKQSSKKKPGNNK